MVLSAGDITEKYFHPGALDNILLQDLEDLSSKVWNQLGANVTDVDSSHIDSQEVSRLCDALRIINRRVLSDSDENFEVKVDLILDVHRMFVGSSQDEFKVSTKALQCLVNLLFNQPNRMKLFVDINGVARLCLSLKQYAAQHYTDSLLVDLQYVIKILFMIKSCSTWMTSPHVSSEDQFQWIVSCVYVLTQLQQCFTQSSISPPLSPVSVGLFSDVCKLLYSLDCYSILEGVTWSDTSFVLFETSVVLGEQLNDDCTVGAARSCLTVLNKTLFGVLMLDSSINDDSSDTNASGDVSGPSPVDTCHQAALQLCMLASQKTVDSMLETGDMSSSSGNRLTLPLIVNHLCCSVLRKCLLLASIDNSISGSSSTADQDRQTHLLSPVLVFYSKLIHSNEEVRREFKRVIFPTPFVKAEGEQKKDRTIDPSDVPEGSLRGLLVPLMISLNTQVKRCVAEFIYTLCDNNVDEFVFRTGFGNAVALLQIKGLL